MTRTPRDPSHRRGPRGPYNTRPPKKKEKTYILICLSDTPNGVSDQYYLAVGRIFTTREQAAEYARHIHPMRKPLVVAGDWIGFHIPNLT